MFPSSISFFSRAPDWYRTLIRLCVCAYIYSRVLCFLYAFRYIQERARNVLMFYGVRPVGRPAVVSVSAVASGFFFVCVLLKLQPSERCSQRSSIGSYHHRSLWTLSCCGSTCGTGIEKAFFSPTSLVLLYVLNCRCDSTSYPFVDRSSH